MSELPEDRTRKQLRDQAKRIAELEAKINAAFNIGHNDDCMFCGFKDKALTTDIVKEQQALKGADDE